MTAPLPPDWQWVMAGLATFIYYGFFTLIVAIGGRTVDIGAIALRQALPAAMYNVVAVTAIYSLLTRLDQRTGEPELRW